MKKSVIWVIVIFLILSCRGNDRFSRNCNSTFVVDDTNLKVDSVFTVRANYSEELWISKQYFLESQIEKITCIDTLINENKLKHFRFIGYLIDEKNKYLVREKIVKVLRPPLPPPRDR